MEKGNGEKVAFLLFVVIFFLVGTWNTNQKRWIKRRENQAPFLCLYIYFCSFRVLEFVPSPLFCGVRKRKWPIIILGREMQGGALLSPQESIVPLTSSPSMSSWVSRIHRLSSPELRSLWLLLFIVTTNFHFHPHFPSGFMPLVALSLIWWSTRLPTFTLMAQPNPSKETDFWHFPTKSETWEAFETNDQSSQST